MLELQNSNVFYRDKTISLNTNEHQLTKLWNIERKNLQTHIVLKCVVFLLKEYSFACHLHFMYILFMETNKTKQKKFWKPKNKELRNLEQGLAWKFGNKS